MHLDAFGHVLTHLDVFGRIWTGFGQVWTGLGRVWKVFGEVWRSLKKFLNRFRLLLLNYRNMKWPNQWILAT